jgi:tetratricopeptide (TPR) repeat protein
MSAADGAMQQGKHEEGIKLFSKAIKLAEQESKTPNEDLAKGLLNLGYVYLTMGKAEQAEKYLSKSLSTTRSLIKDKQAKSSDLTPPLSALSIAYMQQKKYDAALKTTKELLPLQEKALGKENPEVAATCNNLGFLHNKLKNYKEAEFNYKRAMGIREKKLGTFHPEVAACAAGLAEVYDRTGGSVNDAELMYKKILTIEEKNLGPKSEEVGISLNDLAEFYRTHDKLPQAEAAYKKAIQIFEKQPKKKNAELATTLENYALLLQKLKRNSEATAMQNRAKLLR